MRSRVIPKRSIYKNILEIAVPIRMREKILRNVFSTFTPSGKPFSLLRHKTVTKKIIKRLIEHTALISKNPRLAYSAIVKSLGKRPLKAEKKYAS